MDKKDNWYKLRTGEKFFLVSIIFYVILFFLPWSYNIMILDITLMAWAGLLLFFLAPITGLYLILTEKTENSAKGSDNHVG